jgi:predicted AAA+ superfamily ATPase
MRRDVEKELVSWKAQKERYPLLVRGARQVGKSYLVETFGTNHFKNIVTANFEFQPQLKKCFASLDPHTIINTLKLIMGVEIQEESTLLFLDEIQECPEAITSLRYFREKMPRLAVIGAGSLLEYALRSRDFKMPVGRVHFLYVEPLSFSEFLDASGNTPLRQHLSAVQITGSVDDTIHQKLLEFVRTYLIVGGMPAVVREYCATRDFGACQNLQNSLLQTYRSDFGKYANTSRHKYLLKVFDAAPRLVGQRVKYVHMDPEDKSRDLKGALELLTLAGLVKPIPLTHASGLPLGAQTNEQKFKLNFLDVGLMQNSCGLSADLAISNDLIRINSGSVAEQFVGQELRAYTDPHQPSRLFFWARDKRGSSAEVDYIMNVGTDILPLEVKAGKTGTLKSLRIFMDDKQSRLGVRVSQEKLSYTEKILSLPLYMLEQLPRLAQEVLHNSP